MAVGQPVINGTLTVTRDNGDRCRRIVHLRSAGGFKAQMSAPRQLFSKVAAGGA
jgi:hypothetical protein